MAAISDLSDAVEINTAEVKNRPQGVAPIKALLLARGFKAKPSVKIVNRLI